MPTVAIGLPETVAAALAHELGRRGYDVVARCADAAEVATAVGVIVPDIAVVSASALYLDAALLAQCDAAGVRTIAFASSEDERRHAAAIGLHEVVTAEATWIALQPLLEEIRPTVPTGQKSGDGRLIAVWGPSGAPGRTTLAINIAAELASAGFSVALADVDTHGASIAPALALLDEAPGFAAACRLAGADSLNRVELERIGQRYVSAHGSFWVLTGIGRSSRWPELSGERVVAALHECRSWVDYTVLDTASSLESDEEISSDLFAPRRNAATIAALREADRVVAVGAADPVSLSRFLRSHVDLLETVDTGRVSVVMNKVRGSAIGPSPAAQVVQTLQRFGGVSSPVLVPHDPAALDSAVLNGRTLLDTARKSPVRAAIARFVVSRILPPPAEASRRRLRWGRLTAVG